MILILGGGLAGMSTAYHLGDAEHLVLEADERPGGLCRSRHVDGFTFDYTGHLLHVRDPRAIELIERFYPGVFREVSRRAAIRSRGATLPFPYQANLHGLPPKIVADAIVGFVESLDREVSDDPTTSFRDWSLSVFGQGISDGFMFPYNRKLFGRDPSDMTADWVSWAVPKPNLQEVVRGALGIPNEGLGYNPSFRYPERGGIEAVPDAFAERMTHLRCGSRATAVDLDARTVTLEGGEVLSWDRLVVTIPLPAFLRMCRGGGRDWSTDAERLDWTVVTCLNLGIDRPGVGDGLHWLYFPDPDVPFYRVGFPSGFSDGVAPPGTSSMYVEFGTDRGETVDPEALEAKTVAALRAHGILRDADRVVARDFLRIDPGYVIFDRARQEVMADVPPALEAHDVDLIGRYGAWTYSYMERAILDGMELAERLTGERKSP